MSTRSESFGNPDPFSWPAIFHHAQPGNRARQLRASPSGILASYSNNVSRERSFWAELVVAKSLWSPHGKPSIPPLRPPPPRC
jgi:hypothetical protein